MVKTHTATLQPVTMPDGTPTFTAQVQILDESGAVVMTGSTSIATADEQTAMLYVEQVYLPDLVRTMPRRLGDLTLPEPPTPPEPAPETPPEEPPAEPGV